MRNSQTKLPSQVNHPLPPLSFPSYVSPCHVYAYWILGFGHFNLGYGEMVFNKLIFVSIDFRVKLLGFLNRGILIVFLCTIISNYGNGWVNFLNFLLKFLRESCVLIIGLSSLNVEEYETIMPLMNALLNAWNRVTDTNDVIWMMGSIYSFWQSLSFTFMIIVSFAENLDLKFGSNK